MKKWPVLFAMSAISLTFVACAKSNSTNEVKRVARGTQQTEVQVTETKKVTCNYCSETPCEQKIEPVAESIRDDGFSVALKKFIKKYELKQDFDGSDEAFSLVSGELKIAMKSLQLELLQLADEQYRTLYKYDEDITQVGDEVVNHLITTLEAKDMNADDKRKLLGLSSLIVIEPLSVTLINNFQGKEAVTEKVLEACSSSGLKKTAYTVRTETSPNIFVGICPGQLILFAGQEPQERTNQILKLLNSQVAPLLEQSGAEAKDLVLKCLPEKRARANDLRAR